MTTIVLEEPLDQSPSLAEIRSQEEIEVAKISQNQVIEVERKLTETRLIEEIEKRRREQNELEQNAALDIRQKNLDTEVKILNLDKESEYARLEKQRSVDIKKAQERAEIIKEQAERQRDSEEAQIISEEQIKNAKISQQKNVDAYRISAEKETRLLDIEKAKRLKRNEVNRSVLSKVKNNINIFHSLVSSKKADEIQKSLGSVNSALAKAVKKGLIKKEFASRKLSSLSNTIDKK